jgi:hypothetical protein
MSSADSGKTPDYNEKKHEALYHLVYVFGISILFLAINFGFLWPENHLLALLALGVGLSLIAVYELTRMGVRAPRVAGVVLFVFLVCGITYWAIGPIHIPDTEVTGTLDAGASPQSHCEKEMLAASTSAQNSLNVIIGNNGISIANATELPVLAIGSCRVFWVNRGPQGLLISADLFDASGNLIATIRNNDFHAMIGESASIDRKHDLTQLTVKDSEQQEILYVRYLNKDTVRVRGVFGCPGHALVPVRDNEPIPGFLMGGGACLISPGGLTIGKAFFGVDVQ